MEVTHGPVLYKAADTCHGSTDPASSELPVHTSEITFQIYDYTLRTLFMFATPGVACPFPGKNRRGNNSLIVRHFQMHMEPRQRGQLAVYSPPWPPQRKPQLILDINLLLMSHLQISLFIAGWTYDKA